MESEIMQVLQTIAQNIQACSEPKWVEYAAIVLSLISAGISGIAIFVAIQVPQRVAEKQDKIELFEKRLRCYTMLHNTIRFCDYLDHLQEHTNENIQESFEVWFGIKADQNQAVSELMSKMFEMETVLLSGRYLFAQLKGTILEDLTRNLNLVYVATVLYTGKPTDYVDEKTDQEILQLRILGKELSNMLGVIEEEYLSVA